MPSARRRRDRVIDKANVGMDWGEELELDGAALEGDREFQVLFSWAIVASPWDISRDVTLRAIVEDQK
jgi:hypothetical protein